MNTNSSLYKELTLNEIKALLNANFNTDVLHEAKLLEGGLFNTTYMVCYGDDKKRSVLRCGPVNRHLLMAFEENLMQAEMFVYELCEKAKVPCSHVLACDTSKKIMNRDYMFVEYIESVALSSTSIQNGQKPDLYCQVGKYMNQFHAITNSSFGRVSYIVTGRSFSSWYDYLIFEIKDIIQRSRKFNAFSENEIHLITSVLIKYKLLLEEIKKPHLIHSDLWDGNVLISNKNGQYDVAAIIDADRAIFGDVDFEFASPWMINTDFLRGYDVDFDFTDFGSESRRTRRKIYLMLYDLIEAYVGIAEYNNQKQFYDNKKQVLTLALELLSR
ncbi:MAG TPA: fructosamine kinase family protein [Caproicibacter sp.]|nr:fructosamine kinase family protein [Caproicibacter sp.]